MTLRGEFYEGFCALLPTLALQFENENGEPQFNLIVIWFCFGLIVGFSD